MLFPSQFSILDYSFFPEETCSQHQTEKLMDAIGMKEDMTIVEKIFSAVY
jgi:hypothetical protein